MDRGSVKAPLLQGDDSIKAGGSSGNGRDFELRKVRDTGFVNIAILQSADRVAQSTKLIASQGYKRLIREDLAFNASDARTSLGLCCNILGIDQPEGQQVPGSSGGAWTISTSGQGAVTSTQAVGDALANAFALPPDFWQRNSLPRFITVALFYHGTAASPEDRFHLRGTSAPGAASSAAAAERDAWEACALPMLPPPVPSIEPDGHRTRAPGWYGLFSDADSRSSYAAEGGEWQLHAHGYCGLQAVLQMLRGLMFFLASARQLNPDDIPLIPVHLVVVTDSCHGAAWTRNLAKAFEVCLPKEYRSHCAVTVQASSASYSRAGAFAPAFAALQDEGVRSYLLQKWAAVLASGAASSSAATTSPVASPSRRSAAVAAAVSLVAGKSLAAVTSAPHCSFAHVGAASLAGCKLVDDVPGSNGALRRVLLGLGQSQRRTQLVMIQEPAFLAFALQQLVTVDPLAGASLLASVQRRQLAGFAAPEAAVEWLLKNTSWESEEPPTFGTAVVADFSCHCDDSGAYCLSTAFELKFDVSADSYRALRFDAYYECGNWDPHISITADQKGLLIGFRLTHMAHVYNEITAADELVAEGGACGSAVVTRGDASSAALFDLCVLLWTKALGHAVKHAGVKIRSDDGAWRSRVPEYGHTKRARMRISHAALSLLPAVLSSSNSGGSGGGSSAEDGTPTGAHDGDGAGVAPRALMRQGAEALRTDYLAGLRDMETAYTSGKTKGQVPYALYASLLRSLAVEVPVYEPSAGASATFAGAVGGGQEEYPDPSAFERAQACCCSVQ